MEEKPKSTLNRYSRFNSGMTSLLKKSAEALQLQIDQDKENNRVTLDDPLGALLKGVHGYSKYFCRTKPEIHADALLDLFYSNGAQIIRGPDFDDWLIDDEANWNFLTIEDSSAKSKHVLALGAVYKTILNLKSSADRRVMGIGLTLQIAFYQALYNAIMGAVEEEPEDGKIKIQITDDIDEEYPQEEIIDRLQMLEKEILAKRPRGPKPGGLMGGVGNLLEKLRTGNGVGELVNGIRDTLPQVTEFVEKSVKDAGIHEADPETAKTVERVLGIVKEKTAEGSALDGFGKKVQQEGFSKDVLKDAFLQLKTVAHTLTPLPPSVEPTDIPGEGCSGEDAEDEEEPPMP